MKTTSVSNQKFEGRVIGYSWFKPKERRVFKHARPCLENLVKNKDFDIKIYKSYGKLRIGIWKHPDYVEPETNTSGSWISSAKELISAFDRDIKNKNKETK